MESLRELVHVSIFTVKPLPELEPGCDHLILKALQGGHIALGKSHIQHIGVSALFILHKVIHMKSFPF